MEREIKNGLGMLIGKTSDVGNKVYAYDKYGVYKGHYDKYANTTYDEYGSPIGMGDLTAALILKGE